MKESIKIFKRGVVHSVVFKCLVLLDKWPLEGSVGIHVCERGTLVIKRGKSIVPWPNHRLQSKLTTNLPSTFSFQHHGMMQSNILWSQKEEKVSTQLRVDCVPSTRQPRIGFSPREEYSWKEDISWPTGPTTPSAFKRT